jgi:hypothetical protein
VDTHKITILNVAVEQRQQGLEDVSKRKGRRQVRYSKHGVPYKYDGGSVTLARVIKRIAKLYKEGKRVPNSLIKRRMKLGKRKRRK